ncbi:hypothetical protein P9112_014256 [Eukaryota sp. TZLM1-RC]
MGLCGLRFTCRICYRKGLKRYSVIRLQCSHKFCKSCLCNYVNDRLNKPLSLRCPDSSCGARIGNIDMRSFLGRREYRRIEDLINRKLLEHSPLFIMCSNRGCDGYAVLPLVTTDEHDKWRCPHCDRITCTNCRIPDHVGKNCQEYQQFELLNTPLSSFPFPEQKRIRLLRRHTKTCPNGHRTRKVPVTLLEGVDGGQIGSNHVECAVCKVEFCWVCRKEYQRGHFNFRLSYCPIAELMMTLTVNNDVILSSTHLPQQISEYVVGDHDVKKIRVYNIETNLVTHQGDLTSPSLLRPAANRIIIHIRNGSVVQVVCPRGSAPYKLIDHLGMTIISSPAPSTVNPWATPFTPATPAWSTPGFNRHRINIDQAITPDPLLEESPCEGEVGEHGKGSKNRGDAIVGSLPVSHHEIVPPQRAKDSRLLKPFSTPSLTSAKPSSNSFSHPPTAPISTRKGPHSPTPRRRPPPPTNPQENPVGLAPSHIAKAITSAEEKARLNGQTCPTPRSYHKQISDSTLPSELDLQRFRALSNHLSSCLCKKCLLFRSLTFTHPSAYFDSRSDVVPSFNRTTNITSPIFAMDSRSRHSSDMETTSSTRPSMSSSSRRTAVTPPKGHPATCLCRACLDAKASTRGKQESCNESSLEPPLKGSEVRKFLENFGKLPRKQSSANVCTGIGLGSLDDGNNATSPVTMTSKSSDTLSLSPDVAGKK